MKFFTTHVSGAKWTDAHQSAQHITALKGAVYLGNQAINAESFACLLEEANEAHAAMALLQRLNGFYAWVEQTPTALRAGVDHIRSRPLFYGKRNDHFFLGDDAEWVRQQVGDIEMDPLAREEFQLAGYVTGSDTLFPNVKQLQAGEYIEARQVDGEIHVENHRFYRFLHTEPSTFDESALKSELEAVALRSMQRLIDYASGRQIVVPLSGGYDSRLIVTLLKRLGYENIVTFTYGVQGNRESEYSKRVAEALGLRWHFVAYSDDLWREAWRSSDASNYKKMAANHVSLPHIQDWLAVRQLKAKSLIAPDALFAPGHSGDFVAGSHIPAFVFERDLHDQGRLVEAVISAHLSNSPKQGMALAEENALESRILSRIRMPFDGSAIALANLYELWDWQERQAKYIVNSVRAYEQLKFDWAMPLWDIEFIRFWETVPLELRKERAWFKDWISDQYATQIGTGVGSKRMENAADPSAAKRALLSIAAQLPTSAVRALKFFWRLKPKGRHFLAFEGLVPCEELKRYYRKHYNLIGIYSDLYLSNKW